MAVFTPVIKSRAVLYCNQKIHYERFAFWSDLETPFTRLKKRCAMKKYVCDVCGYVYDPANGDPSNGVQPGTKFEDIPADWVCPACGLGKDSVSPVP